MWWKASDTLARASKKGGEILNDFLGVIASEPDSAGFTKALWIETARDHPNLSPIESRQAINPFTKEPMTVAARPEVARVVVEGRELGTMRWATGGESEIHVLGDRDIVGPIAQGVAASLGGRFDPDASGARNEYGRLIGPFWRAISVDEVPEVFQDRFRALPPAVGVLIASHRCQSEVCNGGFHQFFSNATGVLAPEASGGFRAMGLSGWAEILDEAMRFFGEPYPRERAKRLEKLAEVQVGRRGEGNPFRGLDERFYAWLRDDSRRFEKVADGFARASASSVSS